MSAFDDSDAFDAAVPLSQRAMAPRAAPLFDDLNPAQREAVLTLDGPVLMLAGAGTGKTRALTARIAHLLHTGTARPNEILAVTFTNKAAREMKDRVARLLGQAVEGMPWLGTFHAVCVKLLRRHAELVGLKTNFTILDTDDQVRLLKQLILAADIDEKRWPARQLAGLIDHWKNRAWTPDKVPAAEGAAFNNTGVALYAQYQERLRTLNAVDFGDLLLHVLTIFQTHEDVLAQYQRWFRYILVDEYQDTNVAQYLWLRLLAQSHRNICCVGDDDQSIYGWRGAEVGNILRFEKDFPGAKVIRLEQNYRSTPHILAAASGLIAANKGRLGKTLWTEAEEGHKLRLIGHWDGEEEARWIGEELEAMGQGTRGLRPLRLSEAAILVRASHQMRAFEDRFLTIGLPYRVIGGPRFYERMEIRDAMAYFRLAVSPDDDLAFERIVNTPKRGLGDKAQADIQRTARQNGVSLHEGARLLVASKGLGGKGGTELKALVESIDRWHAALRNPSETHIETAERILDESGYTAMWQNDKTPEAPGRLENLKELVKALENFENLQGFPRARLAHHGQRLRRRGRQGVDHDAARGQGAGISGRLPARLGGRPVPLAAVDGRKRAQGPRGGTPPRLCRHHAGGGTLHHLLRRQPPRLRAVAVGHALALHRRTACGPCRRPDAPRPPGGAYGAAAMAGNTIEERAARADVYNSPGWKRLQERSATRGMSQPREARNVIIDLDAVSAFTEGDRVFHQKFGYGAIVGIEGDKLDIAFDKAGEKKVVARFVVPAGAADDVPF
jgi:DNA helicase II / ATP-dependent DNA helicase PcrA